MSEAIYLDYQASTPVDPRVSEKVTSVSDAAVANPHAEDHAGGWAAAKVIELARGQIAQGISALPDEIIFTSGATEADNLGVLGAALGAPKGRRRILVSAFEHKAVLECARAAERLGFEIGYVPVLNEGLVDLAALSEMLSDDVAVVSVMAVNNEVGVLQPIAEIASQVTAAGAFMHTDATQAPLAMDVDVVAWGVDAASFSSHKVYGPKGVGALYLSSAAPWRPRPLMFGGGQEQGLRPGTLPTPLCAGFGLALSLCNSNERLRVGRMRDRLAGALQERLPQLKVSCSDVARHPGCLHVSLTGLDAKDLVTRLQPDIHLATGSACTSGVMHSSHVLAAMGWSGEDAASSLRISIGRFTTDAEVDRAAELIAASVRSPSRILKNDLIALP